MKDSEMLAMLRPDCPMCGPADCACSATEQDQYREIQRLRLTDEERSIVQACAELLEKAGITKAADTLRGLLERLG